MEKSPPSRKRWAVPCSCIGSLLLIGLLCVIPLVMTTRNRLSSVGRRVADASNFARTYDGYYWDSNESQLFHGQIPAMPHWHLDDRSGGITLAGDAPRRQSVRPSPDGKWLLGKRSSNPTHGFYQAFEVSSHRFLQWEAAPRSMTYALWFPDSRRWVEFAQTANGRGVQPIIHSLEGPDRKLTTIADTFIWPIGITASSHVLNARNSDHLELWEYDLEAKAITPVPHRIALPSNASVYEVEGSPDGTRVAYLIKENTASFITHLLDRIFPARANTGKNTMSVWVSRSDGSDLHRIGFEHATEAAGLQWSPDGKRLSLFLDNGFYIIPSN